METGVRQDLNTTPLSTISPRRVPATISRPAQNNDNKEIAEEVRRQENQLLEKLRARDREVRTHEAAHLAAGRPHIRSGPSYTFQEGPDGRAYAIGGEVQLDVSPVPEDPQATLEKAEQIRRAALAPAEPSPQDAQVAANASQMAAQARVEIAAQRREETGNQSGASRSTSPFNRSAIDAFSIGDDSDQPGFSQFA